MANRINQSNSFLFNDFQKEVDEQFTDLIHNLPNELFKYIRSKFLESTTLLKMGSFQLELIVDTNIIFAEVRSLMLNNSSFFLNIVDNPFITVYAPPQLKEELHEKIKEKFPKDKKCKDFDIEECLAKANLILSKIVIRDDIASDSSNLAKSYLQARDENDIPFVALHLTLRTHGVLTGDKDISDLPEIETWRLRDAGSVITELSKGTLSFFILNLSVHAIWELISGIMAAVSLAFLEIVDGLISFFQVILTRSTNAIAKIPPGVAMFIGLAALIILISDSLRGKAYELFQTLWEQVKKFIREIKEVFKEIFEALKGTLEALMSVCNFSFQLHSYLFFRFGQAMKQLEQLEVARANPATT